MTKPLFQEFHEYLKNNNSRYKNTLWKYGASCGYNDDKDAHYLRFSLSNPDKALKKQATDNPLFILQEFYNCMKTGLIPPPHVYQYILNSLEDYFEKPDKNKELSKAFKLPPVKQKKGNPVA